ncbi:hypothetical protein ACOCEA_01910 [Maribacter sp. CXY002]|uniref:hypothetical protein n=1 Tax=Maribacter luteocoastalis TaxID=3407671 RepID=UPI003B681D69
MEIEFGNSDELLNRIGQLKLTDSFLFQIEKDFALANVAFQLPKDIGDNDLLTMIKEKVYYLIMEWFDQYLNLLYIVDVPENEFRKIEANDAVDVAEQVTFLIIKREFQKVWFKKKYN